MAEEELQGLARYAYEVGQLKRSKRTGWWLAGIADPESVAEHTVRTALLGYVLALMEGADPDRTAALCLFHDTAETRLGDIPSVGKRYLTQAPAADVVADQVADLPPEVAGRIIHLVDEYEAQDSLESRVAKDADKLDFGVATDRSDQPALIDPGVGFTPITAGPCVSTRPVTAATRMCPGAPPAVPPPSGSPAPERALAAYAAQPFYTSGVLDARQTASSPPRSASRPVRW